MILFVITQLASMGLPSILLAVAVLGAYVLYKCWDSSRRQRIPTGLKPLPGPKGMALSPSVDHVDKAYSWTLKIIQVPWLTDIC